MRLGGRVAIVTGGARHIGAAYCRRLAEEGAAVVIADILDGVSVADEISAEEWDHVCAVNIKGPFLCAKAVFPQMKEQKSGKIINISSSTAYWGTPNFLHYVASKAALIGMTRALAREVGDYGICVNSIAPGLVEHEGQNAPRALTQLQLKARSIKRLQTPDDLMGTLVFLASSDSDFMTGQAIVVDGGSVFH